MMSWPPGLDFARRYTFPPTEILHDYAEEAWSFKWDDSLGRGQTIYVMENDWPRIASAEVSIPGICC